MINKKNLWFLTLFSLVLVLSVYYVTMPSDLLKAQTYNENNKNKLEVSVEETDAISALKVEDDANTKEKINELQKKLTDSKLKVEEKNTVYEEIKNLNNNSSIENNIEEKIKKEYKCESFTKVENNTVKVIVDKCENSKTLANNIMRLVQEEFNDKMYISVQFKSK
ncbi:MAG: SpoIIIAH-like family protein [Bacilli bacterium]|nr:SpoIIIAH-like family protein [Bacilli bacterium]